jgi:hypothetical protein
MYTDWFFCAHAHRVHSSYKRPKDRDAAEGKHKVEELPLHVCQSLMKKKEKRSITKWHSYGPDRGLLYSWHDLE